MAVTAGALRQRNLQAQAQAKAKRQKLILIVGMVLLVGVLAFQLPKLMKGSSSPSTTSSATTTPAATAATSTPAATPAVAAPTISPAAVKSDLKKIAAFGTKDPFKPQLTATPAASTTGGNPTLASGPSVRLSHFVTKDPFKVQIGAAQPQSASAPLAAPATPVSEPKTTPAVAPHGYIVILRSLDTKAQGLSEVKKAHAHGLKDAGLLYSSAYTSLRHGYWVVYLAKYSSVAAANAGVKSARAAGYSSAYQRPVKK